MDKVSPDQFDVFSQGVEVWNRWKRDNSKESHGMLFPNFRIDFEGVDLSGKDLSNIDLQQSFLMGANLSKANLSNANLMQARLHRADLSCANLSSANLSCAQANNANFRGANLRYASLAIAALIEADFTGANLVGADLDYVMAKGANFTSAIAGETRFTRCKLSEIIGLDSMIHKSWSSVDITTLRWSKQKTPEHFLRGCRVPDNLITYIPSLFGTDIEFYSCFVSYGSRDEEFARHLHRRMRDAQVRVWFAPEDMQSGRKLYEQIETAIRVYDKLLIILSEESLESEWVITELRKAFRAEKESGQRKLFPVRLVDLAILRNWECFDADSGKDLAAELREYFIPDFSRWKEPDEFESAFKRLHTALRSDQS